MPAAAFSIVCLLLAQTGPGVEFEEEPRAPVLRQTPFERAGDRKPPALRPGEPTPYKQKSQEPKTIIRPSSRRPAPSQFEPEHYETPTPATSQPENEPDDQGNDFQPSAAPAPTFRNATEGVPYKIKPSAARPAARLAAPAMPLDSPAEETFEPAPRRGDALGRAKAETPLTSHHEAGQSSAAALLKRALLTAKNKALPGQSITLLAALERVSDRQSQLKVVKGYWLLAAGAAEHHFAVGEIEFLSGLSSPTTAHEQATLAAALAAATAHLRQAELAATATQQDFADLTQVAPGSPLPLPADVPFVGNYRTSFKELFANKSAPAALRRIDRTLPHFRELIEAQAAAVVAAEKSLSAIAGAHESGDASLAGVLEAHAQLRRQRREFLVAVRDYNFSIADYALAVVDPTANRGMLVATLIETAPRTKSVLVTPKRDVQPVSAEEPIGPSESGEVRIVPANNPPSLRAPVPARQDLVPVASPSLRPSEFVPGR